MGTYVQRVSRPSGLPKLLYHPTRTFYTCNLFFMLIDNDCWCFFYVEACTFQFVYNKICMQSVNEVWYCKNYIDDLVLNSDFTRRLSINLIYTHWLFSEVVKRNWTGTVKSAEPTYTPHSTSSTTIWWLVRNAERKFAPSNAPNSFSTPSGSARTVWNPPIPGSKISWLPFDLASHKVLIKCCFSFKYLRTSLWR